MANVNIDELWDNIQSDLVPVVPAVAYDLWIQTLRPLCKVGNKLILMAEDAATQALVEKRFRRNIKDVIDRNYSDKLSDVQVITPAEEELFKDYIEDQADFSDEDEKTSAFISKYTFDNFVVGKSNEFVAAASKAVSENPGKRYNPLFIYGPAGLGKTHLMHAIGNRLHFLRPDLRCLYVSSEHFTNNLIEALRDSNKNDEMKTLPQQVQKRGRSYDRRYSVHRENRFHAGGILSYLQRPV